MLLQPYRKQVLNSIDTIILADIVAITLLNGECANHLDHTWRHSLTAILVSMPILFLICSALFAFVRRCKLKKKTRKWLRRHSAHGKYLYRLSQQLNPHAFEDQLQANLIDPDADDRLRTISTASTSIKYREPYFKYVHYEESDEEEEIYDNKHSNNQIAFKHQSNASSMSSSLPSSSVVTLETSLSTRYDLEETFATSS